MFAGGTEKLREYIMSRSGKSTEEVQKLIDDKKEKFSGLLTEEGAAFMIAKELGVQTEGAIREETRIISLKEGMNNIDIVARVKRAFPSKSYEKNGKSGELQNIILIDGTGEIRATLWNKDIKKFSELGGEKISAIKLANCSVSSYNGVLQLNLNYNSEISAAQGIAIPEPEKKLTPISELEHGMNEVNVEAMIKTIFPAKDWENDRGKGKVMNFIIAKGMEEMRATAWNEACEKIEEIGEDEKVRIEGAYVKENHGNIELHLGRGASIRKLENGEMR
ncbi:MAG TPA: hypothetical protein VJH23_04770 [archaeon]|nr:hypothetical protein [archaeon]